MTEHTHSHTHAPARKENGGKEKEEKVKYLDPRGEETDEEESEYTDPVSGKTFTVKHRKKVASDPYRNLDQAQARAQNAGNRELKNEQGAVSVPGVMVDDPGRVFDGAGIHS